jgi:hypothetical protein
MDSNHYVLVIQEVLSIHLTQEKMRILFQRKFRDGFFSVVPAIITAMLFMNFQYWAIVSHGH